MTDEDVNKNDKITTMKSEDKRSIEYKRSCSSDQCVHQCPPVSTMQLLSILLVALLSAVVSGQHPGTMLHKHNLPGEKSFCNDGTRATYYTQDGSASGSVLIGLQVP